MALLLVPDLSLGGKTSGLELWKLMNTSVLCFEFYLSLGGQSSVYCFSYYITLQNIIRLSILVWLIHSVLQPPFSK
jgi:hypothetical protein